MKTKLATSKRRGQLGGADSDAAAQLACCFGIPTLKYLTDEDVSDLIEFMMYLINTGYADGFKSGWNAALNYNSDCDARLLSEGPSQNH